MLKTENQRESQTVLLFRFIFLCAVFLFSVFFLVVVVIISGLRVLKKRFSYNHTVQIGFNITIGEISGVHWLGLKGKGFWIKFYGPVPFFVCLFIRKGPNATNEHINSLEGQYRPRFVKISAFWGKNVLPYTFFSRWIYKILYIVACAVLWRTQYIDSFETIGIFFQFAKCTFFKPPLGLIMPYDTASWYNALWPDNAENIIAIVWAWAKINLPNNLLSLVCTTTLSYQKFKWLLTTLNTSKHTIF